MKDYKYPEFKYPEEENSSKMKKIEELMISSQLTQSKLFQNDKNKQINIQQPSKYSLYPNVNEGKLGSENNPYGYSSGGGTNNPYGQRNYITNFNVQRNENQYQDEEGEEFQEIDDDQDYEEGGEEGMNFNLGRINNPNMQQSSEIKYNFPGYGYPNLGGGNQNEENQDYEEGGEGMNPENNINMAGEIGNQEIFEGETQEEYGGHVPQRENF